MRFLRPLFLIVAIAEAGSWLGLLAGMYVKYLGSGVETGVKIFGPIHGGLFVAYLVCVALLARENGWSKRTVAVGVLCSIPPLASIGFERWVAKRPGRPADRDGAAAVVRAG